MQIISVAISDKIPPLVAKAKKKKKQLKLVCKFLVERMGYKLFVDPLIFRFKNYFTIYQIPLDRQKQANLTTFRRFRHV